MARARRMVAAALLLLALLAPVRLGSAAQGPATSPSSPFELITRMEEAWRARDAAAWLALLAFQDEEEQREQAAWAGERFDAEESDLRIERPGSLAVGTRELVVSADLFTVREPRGRLEQLLLQLAERPEGWRLVGLRGVAEVDGLVHVTLDPQGYRADGLSVRFDDFELRFTRGTLFLSPQRLGPTALAFVGEGSVRVSPRLEAEREQLRQFCGRPELQEPVTSAFLRIHPADLPRVLDPVRLDPDADAARRWPAAQRLFREQGQRAFVIDAPLLRSPWWLFPGVGDSAVTFETRRFGPLTFTVSSNEPEGISLFDRARQRQICLYPREGGSTRYSEDEGRVADILSHDLRVRFDPLRQALEGEDRLRIRVDRPVSTLRFRLDDALRVESVRSPLGAHLFFRVRNQDSFMVSLGALAGATGEIALSVRFAGRLDPGQLDQEVLQQEPVREGERPGLSESDIPLETVLVYANRTPWYPQGTTEDYAEARVRLETPAGYLGVTGGERVALRTEEGRNVSEYELRRPGRYLTAVVGRLVEAGQRSVPGCELRGIAVPRLRGDGDASLRLAAEMLEFFTAEYGESPYPFLSLVLTEGYTPGGHSPPGMVVLQRRPLLLRGTLRDDPASFVDVPNFFLAHEVAHQWWGHGVAGQNYRERWISEALAHYSAALWVRHTRGESAFQGVLRQMGRWALRYSSLGPIHLGYRLGRLKGDPQIFRAIVYNKGAYVLHMLRGIVGDAAFSKALRSLQDAGRYTKIGTDDLREALEAASGLSLGAYFDAWVFGTRVPALRVAATPVPGAAGRARVRVVVRDLPGPVPLVLTLVHERGREAHRVTLPPEGGEWELAVPGRLQRVEPNGDRGLLVVVE